MPLHPQMHHTLLCSTASSQGSHVVVQVTVAERSTSYLISEKRRSVSASSPRLGSEKILTNILLLLAHIGLLEPLIRSRFNLQFTYVQLYVKIGLNSTFPDLILRSAKYFIILYF